MDKQYKILLDKALRNDLIFSSTNEEIINLKNLLLELKDIQINNSSKSNNEKLEKELKLEKIIDRCAISTWTLNNLYKNFQLEINRIKEISKIEPSIFDFKRLEKRALNLYIKISQNDIIRNQYISDLEDEIRKKVDFDKIQIYKTNNLYILIVQIEDKTYIKKYKEEKIKKLEKKI